jgi:hypothetical protein
MQVILSTDVSQGATGTEYLIDNLQAAGLLELVGDLLLKQHHIPEAIRAFKMCNFFSINTDNTLLHTVCKLFCSFLPSLRRAG